LQREGRADFDAKLAGVEVSGGLFEDRPLPFSLHVVLPRELGFGELRRLEHG
jgi:hypothetical protein